MCYVWGRGQQGDLDQWRKAWLAGSYPIVEHVFLQLGHDPRIGAEVGFEYFNDELIWLGKISAIFLCEIGCISSSANLMLIT